MKKIILLFIVAYLFISPKLNTANAAENLNDYDFLKEMGYSLKLYPSELKNFSEVIDGNIDTYMDIKERNASIVFELTNTTNHISGFYLKHTLQGVGEGHTQNSMYVVFYDSKGNHMGAVIDKDGFIPVSYKNVGRVSLMTASNVRIYEFALKGTIPDSAPVSELNYTATENSIKLNWLLPTIKGLDYIEVNGGNIGKVTTHTIENLQSNTRYPYIVTAVFTNGKKENRTINAQTLPDEIPPGAVTNLKAVEKSGEVELTYTLPTDSDFTHVTIARDGKLIAPNVVTGTFKDTNVLANTEYEYEVIAYDKSVNASPAATVKIKTVDTTVQPVKNIKLEQVGKNVKLTYELPSNENFSHVRIWRNDMSVVSMIKDNTYTDLTRLSYDREYTYKIIAYDKNGNTSEPTYGKITLFEKFVAPVTDLKAKQINEKNVELTYTLPTIDFDYVDIYRDGRMIANKYKNDSFKDESALAYNREYAYKVIAYDKSGMGSEGVITKIKLVSKDITNLKAKATYDQVELSWSAPGATGFEKVTIYRKEKSVSLMAKFVALFTGGLEEELFETNGTTFKDLTVNDDTSYIYRIAASYGNEMTTGKTIEVKTGKVSVSDGSAKEDENGDFLISWTNPTKGKIKVLIAGVEFAVVPAADKKIIIPKDEMKFDLLGKPDVQLIPISESGNEGLPSNPGGGNGSGSIGGGEGAEDIKPEGVLKIAVGLLLLVGGFLLLGMSFWLVPKLIRLIRQAFGDQNSQPEVGTETGRRTN